MRVLVGDCKEHKFNSKKHHKQTFIHAIIILSDLSLSIKMKMKRSNKNMFVPFNLFQGLKIFVLYTVKPANCNTFDTEKMSHLVRCSNLPGSWVQRPSNVNLWDRRNENVFRFNRCCNLPVFQFIGVPICRCSNWQVLVYIQLVLCNDPD